MAKILSKEEFGKFINELPDNGVVAFGVCRNDMSEIDKDRVLQSTFLNVNYEENYGSAKVFKHAVDSVKHLDGVVVYESGNELVYNITEDVLTEVIDVFTPYIDEASAKEHINVYVARALNYIKEITDDFKIVDSNDDNDDSNEKWGKGDFVYRIVFLKSVDEPVETVEGGYLKLYLISKSKAELRSLNLDGLFGKLTNCAWVGNNPYELEWLRDKEVFLKATKQYPNIDYVDKFPLFLHHVVPADNTRILDSRKVRMGAQLASGTVVMPGASYINFNAGTEGPVMVEGRISSSAKVGKGSDIGGGASIMGVLSGGNSDPITVGENTLLGANSGIGISLGDGCIVDAGLYILPGTKVTVTEAELGKILEVNEDSNIEHIQVDSIIFKGSDLSSLNGVHFRQDSVTGKIIAKRSDRTIELNSDLH